MQKSRKSRTRKNGSGGLRGSGGYLRSSSLSSSSPLGGNISYRGGFPDRSRVKLCYVTSDSNSSTVAPVNYVWSGNGCFDPDVTSAGSQPVNWDDWSLQYSRYRVWGSRIIVRAISNVSQADVVLSARHSSSSLGTTTVLSQQCQPYTKAFFVGSNGQHSTQGLGTNHTEMTVSTPQFIGVNSTAFQGADDLTALVTAQPAHQWYWNLSSWHADRVTACVLYFTVVLEYDVEFYDRVETTIDLETRFQQLKEAKHRLGLSSKNDRKSSELGGDEGSSSAPEFEMVQNIRMPINGPPTLVRQSAYSTASRVSSTRN